MPFKKPETLEECARMALVYLERGAIVWNPDAIAARDLLRRAFRDGLRAPQEIALCDQIGACGCPSQSELPPVWARVAECYLCPECLGGLPSAVKRPL